MDACADVVLVTLVYFSSNNWDAEYEDVPIVKKRKVMTCADNAGRKRLDLWLMVLLFEDQQS